MSEQEARIHHVVRAAIVEILHGTDAIFNVVDLCGLGLGGRQCHFLSVEIESDHATAGADGFSEQQRNIASAASDIEARRARGDSDSLEECRGRRLECPPEYA